VWPSLEQTALRLGDEEVSYGELLVIGAAAGRLDEARVATGRAVSALRALAATIGEDELRNEAAAFRRRRRLHSGDDLRRWLEDHELDEKRWTGHLRRSTALRSRLGTPPAPVDDEEVEQALVVDLACEGWWGRFADEAIRLWSAARAFPSGESQQHPCDGKDEDQRTDAALDQNPKRIAESLPSLGVLDFEWCAERLRVFESRRRALAQLEEACSERKVVERRIKERAVDWTEFVYDEIRLPSRAAANEAVMCARDDGLAPNEVAARARIEIERHELRREQIPAGIAAMLTGAVAADVLGPFDEDDGVHVVWLQDRHVPSIDDPATRELAIAELVTDRLDRAAAGRALVVGPL
jgi:hypothetical protein